MKKLAAFAAVLALASCDDVNVHILSGQLYQPQADCLEPSSGIDVVNGGSTGDNCDPQCLSIGEGDATAIYVTTMCPPYPLDYAVEAVDATAGPGDPCTGAFAAFDSSDSSCPENLGDGGDAEASAEASADGGAEAAPDAPQGD